MTNTKTHALATQNVIQFHQEGYLGPFRAYSEPEMSKIRADIERAVLPTPGPDPRRNVHARHLDSRVVHDLVSHPAILERLQCILGDNIVIWSSNFWNKEPGGAEIPWHQDINFWPIEPLLNVTAWIAIDDVTVENSCVQVIPRSHRTLVQHVRSRDGMLLEEEVDPDAMPNLDGVINMELTAGEFFFFNERMLHHSNANTSDKRRLGLAARYTIPQVKILDQDSDPLFAGHQCVLLSGRDHMGLNRMQPASA
jgi:ectoine hydroxylase-related dioxygenase (phytanoyl-CoA dioxygenase family)